LAFSAIFRCNGARGASLGARSTFLILENKSFGARKTDIRGITGEAVINTFSALIIGIVLESARGAFIRASVLS
jgi:hypothetical protein